MRSGAPARRLRLPAMMLAGGSLVAGIGLPAMVRLPAEPPPAARGGVSTGPSLPTPPTLLPGSIGSAGQSGPGGVSLPGGLQLPGETPPGGLPGPPETPGLPGGSGGSSSSQVSANGPSGMNLNAAFGLTEGSPSTVVAYVEGGINWHLAEAAQLVNHIYVNWRQLPIPCSGKTLASATMVIVGANGQSTTESCHLAWSSNAANYDPNGSGVINAAQWANDPRVPRVNGTNYVNPEDLIYAFSCYDRFNETLGTPSWPGGVLHCTNGAAGVSNSGGPYPHDISGWNFYRGGNDPATSDAAYTHSDDQMLAILSTCPKCMIMPVKAGAEALDMTNALAKAWLFACQSGASVVDSVTADIGYSSLMRQVVSYCERRGVAMVEASNDFDSTDHQGGMYWPHVIPGNGAVPDPAGTAWVRSDFTSWGTHNFLTVAGSSTTSQSTAEMGGLVGLLMSWGRIEYQAGRIPHPISGPEAAQVLRATATAVHDTSLGWPGAPGSWSLQYGYGIPNLYKAMRSVGAGARAIPPVTEISSPDWYRLYDPLRGGAGGGSGRAITVSGRVISPDGGKVRWELQYALGPQPAPGAWHTISTGSALGSFSGTFGTLALSKVPKSFWSKPFHLSGGQLSGGKQLSSTEEYAVTLRVLATSARAGFPAGASGESRRAVDVVHSRSWLGCFPLAVGSSGESQPALVDLQGSGRLDIVFGTSNGYVDAIDPKTCKEVPGFPVHTSPVHLGVGSVRGIRPGYQPIVADVAVGDLYGNGRLDVVASTLDGEVYAWSAHGKLLPGWPKSANGGAATLGVPRPNLPYVHLSSNGTLAAPVLVHLGGPPSAGGSAGGSAGRSAGRRSRTLDVVQVGWDGKIHAWTPSGRDVPGWPVAPPPPPGSPPQGYVVLDNQKLITAPAVAYLFGRSSGPDLVVRSEVTWVNNQTSGVGSFGFAYAYDSRGKLLPGWPVKMPGILELTDDAMEFLLEGSYQPAAVPVPATAGGVDDVAVAPALTPPYLIDGTGQIISTYGSAAPGASSVLSEIARLEASPLSGAGGLAGALTGSVSGSVSGAAGFASNPNTNSTGGLKLPLPGSLGPDTPVPLGSSGAFGRIGGVLGYAQSGVGLYSTVDALLLQPNGGIGIKQYESAYPAAGGPAFPGFPAQRQGLDFFGTPIVAPVTSRGGSSVIESGDSSALGAYSLTGSQVPGFPKWTTGWSFFAPSAGDLLSNGHVDLVMTTREGYLFVWKTAGRAAANNQWWRAGHDEYNSDRYGTHSRPPGVPRDVRFTASAAAGGSGGSGGSSGGGVREGRISFVAPGSRWYTGEVAYYKVTFRFGSSGGASSSVTVRLRPSGPSGSKQVLGVPVGTSGVSIQAVNRYGLLGRPVSVTTG